MTRMKESYGWLEISTDPSTAHLNDGILPSLDRRPDKVTRFPYNSCRVNSLPSEEVVQLWKNTSNSSTGLTFILLRLHPSIDTEKENYLKNILENKPLSMS